MNRLATLIFVLVAMTSSQLSAREAPFNRGVNLTNWFQAESAQHIDFSRYSQRDFERIANLGADVIRLPINLHFMTDGAPDYVLDPLFLRYLDEVVDWAEALGLHLVLDNHTFDPAVSTDPAVGVVLEKVWLQMAAHFRNRSERIYYEVMNEPHGISDEDWNRIQQDVVAAIRTVDPVHTIIVGGADWNSYNNLDAMPVYDDDKLIYTFHFYDPFVFTHQGASWVEPSMAPLAGVPFPHDPARMPALPPSLEGSWIGNAFGRYATEGTEAHLREQLDIAIRFRDQRNVPLFLGELGVLMSNSPGDDRVHWHRVVREYLEMNNIAWTLWDYHGGFGVYEKNSDGLFGQDLNVPLLEALGFSPPPQVQPVRQADTAGFEVYTDEIGPGIAFSGHGGGTRDLDSVEQAYEGSRVIHWTGANQYDRLGFDFRPDKDLSFLESSGYMLDFMVRGDTPGTRFDVRFIDSRTGDAGDRPWRIGMAIDEDLVPFDGEWHQVQVPLSGLEEQGAWQDGNWYPPEGLFDWSDVDRLEIVNDQDTLQNASLWFDRVRISRQLPGPPRLSHLEAMNGLFFDPGAPGHGFDFNYLEAGLVVFYYGHTAGGERLWLISETYGGRIGFGEPIELGFYEVRDGVFGAPGQEATTWWGTITLTPEDCNTAHAVFDGLDGMMEMETVRLAGLRATSCSR